MHGEMFSIYLETTLRKAAESHSLITIIKMQIIFARAISKINKLLFGGSVLVGV